MDKTIKIVRRATEHSRTHTHSRYEESKGSRPQEYNTHRDSNKYRKRSRSSRKYSKYSSKYNSGTSERRFRDSSRDRLKRRDRKYEDKEKEKDFKVPTKFSVTSSEYKKKKEHK